MDERELETGFEGLQAGGGQMVVGCPAFGCMVSTSICDGSKHGIKCNFFGSLEVRERKEAPPRAMVTCRYPRQIDAHLLVERMNEKGEDHG